VDTNNATAGGFDPNDLTTGQVVGLAVGAALALGSVVAALGPNEPEKPPHSGGRRTVVRGAHSVVRDNPAAPGLSVVQNGKISGRTRRRLERETAELQQEIDRLEKIAAKQEHKEQPPIPAASVMLPVSGMESVKMADDPVIAVLKNGKLTRRTRKQLHKQVNALQKDIDRLDKAVRTESYRQTHPTPTADDVRESVNTFGQDASKRLAVAGAATSAVLAPLIERAQAIEVPKGAQQAAGRAQKNISQFASSAQKSAGHLADVGQKNASQFSDTAQKSFGQFVESAQKNLGQFAEVAQKNAGQFAGAAREQTADLSDRVRTDFLPQLAAQASKVQERVQEQAPQLAEQFRDEVLPQVAERLQQFRDEVLPQVVERAQQFRDEVTPQLADAAAKAGAQASALAATGVALGRDKAKELAGSDLAGQINKQASKTVARAEKQTRKSRKEAAKGVSALTAQLVPQKQKRSLSGLWTVAAVAAVGGGLYYVFGNEERRNKVIGTARSIIEQGREIVRDFRGYDEEF
jgi:hypothetical protein